MDVLKRIEELRIEKGWTKNKLAEEAGLAISTVYNWYSDRSYAPSRYAIECICNALQISITEFYYGVDDLSLRADQLALLEYWESFNLEQRKSLLAFFKSLNLN